MVSDKLNNLSFEDLEKISSEIITMFITIVTGVNKIFLRAFLRFFVDSISKININNIAIIIFTT